MCRMRPRCSDLCFSDTLYSSVLKLKSKFCFQTIYKTIELFYIGTLFFESKSYVLALVLSTMTLQGRLLIVLDGTKPWLGCMWFASLGLYHLYCTVLIISWERLKPISKERWIVFNWYGRPLHT